MAGGGARGVPRRHARTRDETEMTSGVRATECVCHAGIFSTSAPETSSSDEVIRRPVSIRRADTHHDVVAQGPGRRDRHGRWMRSVVGRG